MNLLKKFIFVLFGLLAAFVVSIYFFRDFLIQWGANTFFLVGAPYSIRLNAVETKRDKSWNHYLFKMGGTFEGASFTMEGLTQVFPLRANPLKVRIQQLPLTAINRKVAARTGFIFTKGVADIQASGSLQATAIHMDAHVVLRNFAIREAKVAFIPLKSGLMNYMAANGKSLPVAVYIRGNPINPSFQWSANIQNFLAPTLLKIPVAPIEKILTPFKKLFPQRSQ